MPLGTTAALETLKAVLKAIDPSWRSGVSRYLALHTANPGRCWIKVVFADGRPMTFPEGETGIEVVIARGPGS